MTDVLLSEQRISRRERHIAKLEKDCYYVEFVQQGEINVLQAGQTLLSNPGAGTVFSASEACDLIIFVLDGLMRWKRAIDHFSDLASLSAIRFVKYAKSDGAKVR